MNDSHLHHFIVCFTLFLSVKWFKASKPVVFSFCPIIYRFCPIQICFNNRSVALYQWVGSYIINFTYKDENEFNLQSNGDHMTTKCPCHDKPLPSNGLWCRESFDELQLRSRFNTELQLTEERQLQDETGNIYVFGFVAPYLRGLTVSVIRVWGLLTGPCLTRSVQPA